MKLPRNTIRLRLTLLYGGLFIASSVVLLGITYLFVARRYESGGIFTTRTPLTTRSIGRTVVVPLANRTSNDRPPALAAFTAQEMPLPTALSPLTNPLPVNPVWLDSTTLAVNAHVSA